MPANSGGTGLRRRVAVLGGTFDPPHNGHLALAAAAMDQLEVDGVVVVVAGDPWQKSQVAAVTPGDRRLAMTELAFGSLSYVDVDDREVRRDGPSYTIDTLEEFADQGDDIVLVVGSDAAGSLAGWHRSADLPALAQLAVARRAGDDSAPVISHDPWSSAATVSLDLPLLDISSRGLRALVRQGLHIDGLVPADVVAYVEAHALYRDGR